MIPSGIYQIQSKIHPDRIYIGSAVNIQRRWFGHIFDLRKNKHGNSKLQRHFNKYGEQDFNFTTLEECYKESLIQREQHYIDAVNPWFNIAKIAGSSMLGRNHSEETRYKMSEKLVGNSRNIGRSFSEEHKNNLSASHKDKYFSEEHKNNISKAKIGCTPWNKGIPHSEEAKCNMRKPHKDNGGLMGRVPWNKGLKLKVA